MSAQSPLRCHDAAPYLSAFADGELAEPLRTQIAAHLATCESCAATVASYRGIDALLGALPASRPSASVFENVQSAIEAQADPRAVRESLRRARRSSVLQRRLTVVGAPTYTPPSVSRRPATRRSRVLAAAVPTIAALVLIGLTLIAFSRARPHPNGPLATNTTPAPAGTVLQRTQQAIAAKQSELTFKPVLPRYLPSGAALGPVTVSYAASGNQQPQQAYLDVTWNVSSGAVCQIHLREAPGALGWVGYAPGGVNALLFWQLPSAQPWRPLNVQQTSERPAVGQSRGTFSIALDVAPCAAADTSGDDIAALRIISLSMDALYTPLSITPNSGAGHVLHYAEVGTDAKGAVLFRREVYTTADQAQQRIETFAPDGTHLSATIIQGDQAIQLNYATQQAFSGPVSAVGGPAPLPSTRAMRIFFSATSFIYQGELWNLGPGTYQGAQVYTLALVNGPQPATVYVDLTSHQVIAVRLTTTDATQPGGPSAEPLFPASTCGNYTFIEYLAQAPGGAFSQQAPTGFQAGGTALSPPACPS
jgi:hypothetical protein